jgi:2-C-methyl-D-erythritol 4-phosphate cytidylyltransferase
VKKYAIIVAGGNGTRMRTDLPKQFLPLKGKAILYYSIASFLEAYNDLQVIVVLPSAWIEKGQKIVNEFHQKERITITTGGDSRFQSVKNGLALVEGEAVIFVHDAVRCLLSRELIERCYTKALYTGSAIPVIPSKDSVRLMTESGSEVFDRTKVMLVQTPQTFLSKVILPAFNVDYKDSFTDEATVVEATGIKVSLVDGDENNIKITHSIDLVIAEKLLENKD